MTQPPSVHAVIINFRTPDLTARAVRSLRAFYPDLPLLLIDNGSGDGSDRVLASLQAGAAAVTDLLLLDTNIHHGPAMDQALRQLQAPWILFLDSDIEIHSPGLIEGMMSAAAGDQNAYAVGKRIWMNRRGFDQPEGAGVPYVRPICMLLRRELYPPLPPFRKHGAPCLANMKAAHKRGLHLVHFPVEDYLTHAGRGTASRHGYRLGLRGKINHLLNSLGL